MKKLIVLVFVCTALSSCFLFSKYKKSSFTYTQGGQSRTVPIIVPKGYKKEKTEIDSSGNTILTYGYGDRALFYVAYAEDSNLVIQPIAEADNIPRNPGVETLVFKGMDADNLFWREVRRDGLRFGYRYVTGAQEIRFDSATNFGLWMKFKIQK